MKFRGEIISFLSNLDTLLLDQITTSKIIVFTFNYVPFNDNKLMIIS